MSPSLWSPLFPPNTQEYSGILATAVPLSFFFFLTVSALVFETGIGERVSGSSGMEDGPWRAASCFDGSRLLLRWSDEAGTSRPKSCQKNYPSSHLSMHGVPPGGKIQLLHMAEEEDNNEWKEQEVELHMRTMELFALFWEILIKQTKQFSPLHPKCLPLHCSSSC